MSASALLLAFLKQFETADYDGMIELFAVDAKYQMRDGKAKQFVWSGRRVIVEKLMEIRKNMPAAPKIGVRFTRKSERSASCRWELRCSIGACAAYENSGTLEAFVQTGCIKSIHETLNLKVVQKLLLSEKSSTQI
jgi:hypothetical protein